jgi:predicted secreted Zn-dependent protease
MRVLASIASAAIVAALAGNAAAKPKHTTSYSYYSVSGDSAGELYSSMLRRGPHVDGQKAYAATSAKHRFQARFVQGSSCKIKDLTLSFEFSIRLPKAKDPKALKGSTKVGWAAFSDFVRKHEEMHRTIWLGCAQELERRILAIRTNSCDKAERMAEELDSAAWESCNKKHNAFDAAEQLRLAKHPFVRQVLAPPKNKSAALASGQKKKKRKG